MTPEKKYTHGVLKGAPAMEEKWVLCPVCKSKTRVKLREDTVLRNFLLFCPKCKQESVISAENMSIIVHK